MSHEEKISFNSAGNLLICDQFNHRVIETTPRGDIVWQYGRGPLDFTPSSVIGVRSAQRIGKLTLIASSGIYPGLVNEALNGVADSRVILVNHKKEIIWQYGQFGKIGSLGGLLDTPSYAIFLPSEDSNKGGIRGNFLITDKGNHRIIEVNGKGEIIWQYPGLNITEEGRLRSPNTAERLSCGHFLIADEDNKRAIEINHKHEVIKVFNGHGQLGKCTYAMRLPNGNTLLTDSDNSRVIEVNNDDIIVWQHITNMHTTSVPEPSPNRAVRLKNGDTLISDTFNNRVLRINGMNTIIGYYGLPTEGATNLIGSNLVGTNNGYSPMTTQLGLYGPTDTRIIE